MQDCLFCGRVRNQYICCNTAHARHVHSRASSSDPTYNISGQGRHYELRRFVCEE